MTNSAATLLLIDFIIYKNSNCRIRHNVTLFLIQTFSGMQLNTSSDSNIVQLPLWFDRFALIRGSGWHSRVQNKGHRAHSLDQCIQQDTPRVPIRWTTGEVPTIGTTRQWGTITKQESAVKQATTWWRNELLDFLAKHINWLVIILRQPNANPQFLNVWHVFF